ncbi:MAG: putative motility protein [Fibrobacteres bacterium]|nr:putative motility protein [Fibrobacterota bacterium]
MNVDSLLNSSGLSAQNAISATILKKTQDIAEQQATQLIQSLESASPKNGRVDGYA